MTIHLQFNSVNKRCKLHKAKDRPRENFKDVRFLTVLTILIFNQIIYAQLSLSNDAYKLFTEKSSTLKLGYLGYSGSLGSSLFVEKLNDKQNLAYAKLGIRRVIVVRELKGVKDTLAIRKYNSEGFLSERDTFNLNSVHKNKKYLSKTYYDYFLKDNIVKMKSQDIVIKADTSYEWQESINVIFYYDMKNRLIRRKSWSSKDTLDIGFESDSNGIITATKRYSLYNTSTGHEPFGYILDEKGRLTDFFRYYNYNPQIPGRDSSITQLVYDDKKHSITIYPEKACHDTYYIRKRRQVFIDYFCPSFTGKSNSETVYITILDRRLRVKSMRIKAQFDKSLNIKNNPFYKLDKYRYNSKGLLSTITTSSKDKSWDQKIFFYYFTK